jgi:hypothetical protein
MSRLRNRPDRFTFKGDPYAFHRIQDGATLGRLDPYASTEQRWLLHSGRVLMVTGADVRDITEQVHGIKLPTSRPTGDWDEERVAAIEENIRLLFQLVGAIEVAQPREEPPAPPPPPPPPPPPVEEEPPQLLPEPDALMSDYGPVGEEADITGDMLMDAFEVDEAETFATFLTLSATRQKHISEQLHVTRAALDREHQATGIANPRAASIDRFIGLMTRRGET